MQLLSQQYAVIVCNIIYAVLLSQQYAVIVCNIIYAVLLSQQYAVIICNIICVDSVVLLFAILFKISSILLHYIDITTITTLYLRYIIF